ncbi:MAG: response regulator [Hyphomicrobiales bacterium]|nr:response regulator [Hyphomicrobiales bacterium]MCP5372804.1 response regulator [Hyphomicrobiales bacterium]
MQRGDKNGGNPQSLSAMDGSVPAPPEAVGRAQGRFPWARGIGGKILGLVILPLVIMAAVGAVGLNSITDQFRRTVENQKVQDGERDLLKSLVNDVNSSLGQVLTGTNGFLRVHQESLLMRDPTLARRSEETRDMVEGDIRRFQVSVTVLQQALGSLPSFRPGDAGAATDVNRRHLNVVTRTAASLPYLFKLLKDANGRTAALLAEGDFANANENFVYEERFVLEAFDTALARIRTSLVTVSGLIDADLENQHQALLAATEATIRREVSENAAIALALALAILVSAFLLARTITRPLLRLSGSAGAVIDGTATTLPGHDRDDEIGVLARSLETVLNRLRTSNGLLRTVMDVAPPMIVVLDGDGRYLLSNKAVADAYGETPEAMVGCRQADLHPDRHECEAFRRRNEAVRASGEMDETADEHFTDAEGNVHVLQTYRVPLDLDGARAVLAISVDISERLDAERAAQAANAANHAKSAFLANMSHELRTPLNAIIGYSEMILEDMEEAEDSEFAEDIRRIHHGGVHLLSLINDILDLSKIEAGKMELSVDGIFVPTLIDEITATAQSLVAKNSNEFVIDVADDVADEARNDPVKLRQIVLNFLSNAAKFTSDGRITLSVRRTEADGRDMLSIAVSDTGIGMDQDQIERLFQEFTQADSSTSRKYGGTGLGLAICRRFSEMMGGGIVVESAPGAGSTFTLTTPVNVDDGHAAEPAAPAPEAAAAQVGPADPAGMTVLVIDDDGAARTLLTRHLTKQGYHVATAENGTSGLELARKLAPDAITLDVMMPDKDGWSVLKELKADEITKDIPVVMCTIVDDKNVGLSLGAIDHLTKPIHRDGFLSTIRRCIGVPGAQDYVLVVDDDDDARNLMATYAGKICPRVSVAGNGIEALEVLARQGPPASVLLDLMMPEMDGLTFLRHIRSRPDLATVPVIVVSSKDLTTDEAEFLRQAAQSIVAKQGSALEDTLDSVVAELRTHAAPAAPSEMAAE